MKVGVLILVLLICFSCNHPDLLGEGSTALELTSSQGKFDTTSFLYILEDPSRDLTVQAVSSKGLLDTFRKVTNTTPNLGFTSSAIWIKIKLVNKDDFQRTWILNVDFPLIDDIQLFIPTDEDWQKVEKGLLFPFAQRGLQRRTFLFDIEFKPFEEKTVYLRFQSEDTMQIPIVFWTPEAFIEQDRQEQFFNGIYFGILIVMGAYNLVIFLILRDRSHLYYVIYIIFFALFVASQYGIAYQYLWPNFNTGARLLNPFLASLLEFSALLFSGHFLKLQKMFPRLNRVRIILMLAGLMAALSSVFIPLKNSAISVVVLGLLTAVFIILIGILSLKAGYRPARYFVAAFSILILGAVIYALKTFGAIPANFLTNYGMLFGSAIEVTLLSLGLGDRISVLLERDEQAQQLLLARKEEALRSQILLTLSYARMVPQAFIRLLEKESILEVNPGDQIQKEMTVLFSDIRSFTTLSESMTPEENFNFLNSYLQRMNPIIESFGGFIDKYIGDGIMAIFPNSSQHAVNAAIEMQRELILYNIQRQSVGYIPLQVGIGIHVGNVMFGTLGNENRMEFTAIADVVNLASRIEQLSKEYGSQILISDFVYQQLENIGQYFIRFIESRTVRGRSGQLEIYEVLDGRLEEEKAAYRDTLPDFMKGVQLFSEGSFPAARASFERVLSTNDKDLAAASYLRKLEVY